MTSASQTYFSKIAIIVPIYNVEVYLAECLESIRSQSYSNWICILVDDGSTDTSGEIADSFANLDSRFRVIHTTNGGLSSARNIGLELINNSKELIDYIGFVDSDDRIESNMYSSLLSSISANNADFAVCGAYKFVDNNRQHKPLPENEEIISSEEFVDLVFSFGRWNDSCISGGMVWKCLYKKDIIDGLHFPKSKDLLEDEIFSMQVATKSKRICIVNKVLYGYRQRHNSLVQNEKFDLLQKNCRNACIKEAIKISERAYLVTIGAYISASINLLKKSSHENLLNLQQYETEITRGYQQGFVTRKTYILYKLFANYPLLSKIYRNGRSAFKSLSK